MRIRDFRLLLTGYAASKLGSQVTLLALPLAAIMQLNASPFELALLTAIETAALTAVGLPAGSWVDRRARLPLLIQTDVVRFVAIASVPVAAVLGGLTMVQLFVVAGVTGAATVVSDVANQSAVPAIVSRDNLIGANGALASVQSTAEVMGPGLGGGLVQLVGAPFALITDAVSYAVSAVLLAGVRTRETVVRATGRRSMWRDIGEGIGFIARHPMLRVIAVTTGLANLFAAYLFAVQIVFWTRELLLPPLGIGLVLSASAVGGLAGALLAKRLAQRVGQVRLILLSIGVTSPFALLWPLSSGVSGPYLFALGLAIVWFGAVAYNIAQLTFRQMICPNELLGRMNATMRFVATVVMPIGALAGGAVITAAGPRAAMWVCALGFLTGPLPLLVSPLRWMRDVPAEAAAVPDAPPEQGAADQDT